MTQSPQSGQGAPPRSEFGSVTAPPSPPPAGRDARSYQWSTPSTQAHAPTPTQRGTNGHAPVGVAATPPAGYDPRNTTAPPPLHAPGPAAPPQTAPQAPPPAAPVAPAPSGRLRGSRNRGPRRARLQLRHINPWTVLKFSCVLSIALFFVWLIVVGILFGVLDAAGVVKTLNDAYIQINPGSQAPIRAGIVFGGAAIVGAVNIVLFIALSTVGAVVYNLCADLVGGIEITLSER